MKRYSRKREAILQAIRSTTTHPTAEWVYANLKPDIPDLSLATVYRNIAAFLESGEIISVGVVESKERYDGNVDPHSHFICEKCCSVFDVASGDNENMDRDAESAIGAKVTRHELTFYGICAECLKNYHTQA